MAFLLLFAAHVSKMGCCGDSRRRCRSKSRIAAWIRAELLINRQAAFWEKGCQVAVHWPLRAKQRLINSKSVGKKVPVTSQMELLSPIFSLLIWFFISLFFCHKTWVSLGESWCSKIIMITKKEKHKSLMVDFWLFWLIYFLDTCRKKLKVTSKLMEYLFI